MKKFKTVLTAIVMLLSATAFATGPEKVSVVVKAAFEGDFAKASQVSWQKSNDFYFATFKLNNVHVDAAYNVQGELIGTSRMIDKDQLPLAVSLSLAELYEGYKVEESVIELNFEGITRYYVKVSNARKEIKLKCYSNGDLEIESKTKKS